MSQFTDSLIAESPQMHSVLWAAQLSAASDVTLLIRGESGTGKELLAQSVHQDSPRKNAPLITVNCASIPEQLAESLLFGHVKGAFSGADRDHQGYVQAAHGGTLFLDEIGELPLTLQAKLLRFLESGECQPVGAIKPHQVDVRVIAATHRDLADEVTQGNFRQDLFYRLNVVPLELPALRERTGDFELLLKHLTRQLANKHSVESPSYSKATLKQLKGYGWPGNIRELRNFCERMVILLPGREVEPQNLPIEFQNQVSSKQDRLFSLPESGISLEDVELQLIQQALDRSDQNRSQAARLLGLSRDTLLYRMKKHMLR